MKKRIGTWQLGSFDTEVWVTSESGGSYSSCGVEDTHLPWMEIGLNEVRWSLVLGTLLHETCESVLHAQKGASFEKAQSQNTCAGNRWFFLDHAIFTEMCEDIAPFLTYAMPAVAKAWAEFKKKQKQTDKFTKAVPRTKRKPVKPKHRRKK